MAFVLKGVSSSTFSDIKWKLQEKIISGFPANKILSLTKKVSVY